MTPSIQRDGLVGTVLQDSFQLTRLIGQGGMGTVYEGKQLRLNRRVAVKLLARELASNEEALARFHREAEVTSQLGHPHIVQVFDFGTAPSGEPYLVMEFLEGEDLDQRIRRVGRLPFASVLHIVRQVASALSSTHAKGIVHRDLKPANIFLVEAEGETDFVKIVDFGISKVRAATVQITAASMVMGTPSYMSPEQAAGLTDRIDQATDQWSLACIVYELLAGRGPFVGDTVQSLLYQVVHQEPPSLAALTPGLPSGAEATIRRALSKQQGDRFPSINAFARALTGASPVITELTDAGRAAPTALLRDPTRPSPLATTSEALTPILVGRSRKRAMALVAGLVTLGVVVVFGARLGRTKPTPVTPAALAPPAASRLPPPAPTAVPTSPVAPMAVATPPVPAAAPSAPPSPPPQKRVHEAARDGQRHKQKPDRHERLPAGERTGVQPPATGPKRHLIEEL